MVTHRFTRQHLNEDLLNQMIGHSVHLQRYQIYRTAKVIRIFNLQVLPAVIGWVINVLSSRHRLQEPLRPEEQKAMPEIMGYLIGELTAISSELAEHEASYISRLMSSSMKTIRGVKVQLPVMELMNFMVESKPLDGIPLSQWVAKASDLCRTEISRQINLGLVNGESVPDIVRRIKGTADAAFGDGTAAKIRRSITAVVRTSINHATTTARELTYKANSDIVKAVQIVATLDHRTCEVCGARDGQVYEIDEGPRPPYHYNCRCTTAPVVKSWQELGLDAKEVPETTRASMNGQVPSKVTFPKWLSTQSPQVQDDILGPEKAKLFRTGKVTVDRFVDDYGRSMTLEQIKRREGL